jgi:hypothetical protein
MEVGSKAHRTPRKQPVDSIPTTSIPNLNAGSNYRFNGDDILAARTQKAEAARTRLEALVAQLKTETKQLNKNHETPSRAKSAPRRAKTPGRDKTPSRSKTPSERIIEEYQEKKKNDYLEKYYHHDDRPVLPPEIIRSKSTFNSSPIYKARRRMTPGRKEQPPAPVTIRVSMGELLKGRPQVTKQQTMDDDLKKMDQRHRDMKQRYYSAKENGANWADVIAPQYLRNRPKTPNERPKTPKERPKTPTSRPKTPNERPKTPSESARKRALTPGRRISSLQREWDNLINLADEELTRTSDVLHDDLKSPTPQKSRREKETDFLVGKMLEKNVEYWDQQANSENPAFGSRVPDPKHGYLSSYAKRHSIKRFLDRNPEKQDCMRRKLIFSPGRAITVQDESKDASDSDTSQMNDPKRELRFKSPGIKERLERVRQHSASKKKANADSSLLGDSKLNDSRISSSLLSEGSSPTKKLLLKQDLYNYDNKYIVLDVMKKRLLSHENVKEFVTQVIEENDTDTMGILIKDPKIRHMMVESLGEMVLIKMMGDKKEAEKKANTPKRNTPHKKVLHEPPMKKIYIDESEEEAEPVVEKVKPKAADTSDLVGSLRWEYLKLMEDEKKRNANKS